MKKSLLSLVVLAFVFGLFNLNITSVNAQSAQNTTIAVPAISAELGVGSRGYDVNILQQFLKDEGYLTGKVDGVYGNKTYRSVRDYQDDNNLEVNGRVDAATRIFINSELSKGQKPIVVPVSKGIITTTLDVGSRGAEVRILQQFLKDQGYYSGVIDGIYGNKTARYVKDFQDDNGLNATGRVDVQTRALINSMLGGETVGSSQYDDFTSCLTQKGATLYGAYWSPYGAKIKELFGQSFKNINYVECSTTGGYNETQICKDKNITGYPTWVFADGSRLSGFAAADLHLQSLVEKTSCSLTRTSNIPKITKIDGPQSLNVNQKGTWSISASSQSNTNLTYAVVWGDEVNMRGSASENGVPASAQTQQTATFTHTYTNAGVYKPIFYVISPNTIVCITYPCPGNGGTAEASLTVNVGGVGSSSLKVLSPNGGETWLKGTRQTIKWMSSESVNDCINCGKPAPKYYDIKLSRYNECTGNICPLWYSQDYIIFKSVLGNSYDWFVGDVWDKGIGPVAGSYKVEVCQTGTSLCDSSDSYFKISSDTSSEVSNIKIRPVNRANKVYQQGQRDVVLAEFNITGVSGPSSTMSIGNLWNFRKDENGSYNQYGLSIPAHFRNFSLWINGVEYARTAEAGLDGLISFTNRDFTISTGSTITVVLKADTVSASGNGTYKFALSGYGNSGNVVIDYLDASSFVISGADSEVQVMGSASYGTVNVISPNGGETINAGSTYSIRWESSGFGFGSWAQIQLRDAYNPTNNLSTIVGSMDNTGIYSWNVPSTTPTGKYLIWVTVGSGNDSDGSRVLGSDYSNNEFSINGMVTTLGALSIDPSYISVNVGASKTAKALYTAGCTASAGSGCSGATTDVTFSGASWSIANTSIAQVVQNAEGCASGQCAVLYIKGIAPGTTELTATYKESNGNTLTKSIKVVVEAVVLPYSNVIGYADVISCSLIGGWALNLDRKNDVIPVVIYDEVDGYRKMIYRGETNVPRPDVNQAYTATGNHGFNMVPSFNGDGRSHKISVFALGNNGEELPLNNSVKTVLCTLGSRVSPSNLTASVGSLFSNTTVQNNVATTTPYYFTQFLEQGSRGEDVRELQKVLNNRGYNVGIVDGVFGPKVKEMLIKFQVANGLKADGIFGYEMRTFLNK